MKPDARRHNPDPSYLRGLIARAGVTQEAAAAALGMSARQLRYYLQVGADPEKRQEAPYPVQFALEQLATNHDTTGT